MGLLELESLAGEKIGLFGRKEVGPPGVRLAADMVTYAAIEEVFVTSAPPPFNLPLPEGSGSRLISGPVLSGVGMKSGNLLFETVPGVLKGLLN